MDFWIENTKPQYHSVIVFDASSPFDKHIETATEYQPFSIFINVFFIAAF